MTSPSRSDCCCARCGLTQAVGSHVIFVSGLGSSCSQPLFAKRPSQMVGSGLKMISRPALGVGDRGSGIGFGATPPAGAEVEATAAEAAAFPTPDPRSPAPVPGIHPSCSTCFQNESGLLNGCPVASVMA